MILLKDYDKLKKEIQRIFKNIDTLLPSLESLTKDMDKVYEILRYQNLNVTGQEYSVLYGSFVSAFEDSEIEGKLLDVIESLKEMQNHRGNI